MGRLVSDMGGRLSGPIDRTEHAPSARDKRIDAMKSLVQRRDARFTSDISRRAQEELDQETYEGLPYYDRWLVSFKQNLIEGGYLSDGEIAQRIAAIRARAQR